MDNKYLVEKICIECEAKFLVRTQHVKKQVRCKDCQAYYVHVKLMALQRKRREKLK